MIQTVRLRDIPFDDVHPGAKGRRGAREIWEALRGQPVKIDSDSLVKVDQPHGGHCCGRHWRITDPDFMAIMEDLFGQEFPKGTTLCEHQLDLG